MVIRSNGGFSCIALLSRLCEQLVDHLAVDVGQPEIAALESEGQLRVVEAEKVHHRRVEVVDVDAVLGDVEAEFVALAHDEPLFHAASGEPHGERVRVMVAAIFAALDHRCTSEFATPNDECIFEQTALFEVEDERG